MGLEIHNLTPVIIEFVFLRPLIRNAMTICNNYHNKSSVVPQTVHILNLLAPLEMDRSNRLFYLRYFINIISEGKAEADHCWVLLYILFVKWRLL